MRIEDVKGYTLKKRETIEEIGAEGYILSHDKTGARICIIACDDNNKVFSIGFCTPPSDDTGVAHINEHSVLCGSKRYPAKDPFVELVKGSLNTFLNAMTYPDKTVYPVASCNEQDFKNLMSVYMDAVFYPNIYKNEKIFRQEGWHYEMTDPDGEITYNGVVYNEMKGAFSSPDGVLDRYTRQALFPDTTYGCESGGDPEKIPDLTYEDFLSFHSNYYHPSNSYIYLYGDCDMAERLTWLDENYLNNFERLDFDAASLITLQPAFDSMISKTIEYGIAQEEDEESGVYLSWNKAIGSALDTMEVFAFQILEYVLLASPGAVLLKALTQKGIGEDIYGGFEPGIRQTMFSVVAKGAKEADADLFVETIIETLEKLVKEGINRKSLLAGIVNCEFRNREADFGRYPKGLIWGLNLLDTWLYNDNAAFDRLKFNPIYEFLKKEVADPNSRYFEELIEKKLLNNQHGAIVNALPKKGLTEEKEARIAQKLAAYKATLSQKEIEEIIRATEELKAYQDEPSAKEDLDLIPMIHVADIAKEATPFVMKQLPVREEDRGIQIIQHDLFTSGISYLILSFDANCVALEDYMNFSILQSVMGTVNTEHYTYEELPDEINIQTGGMSGKITSYQNLNDDTIKMRFEISTKMMAGQTKAALDLVHEIIHTSDFSSKERIKELLLRMRSRLEQKFLSGGHSVAISRASSYFSEEEYRNELLDGITFYHNLCDLIEHYEERFDTLRMDLERLAKMLCRKENMLVSITAQEDGVAAFKEHFPAFAATLSDAHYETAAPLPTGELEAKNEGFTSSSQVNYAAVCGNFKKAGFAYHGSMKVLSMLLDYDYLWTNLRVKGGAYGCMSGFAKDGGVYLVSYRDPEVCKTYEVYQGLPAYLENYDPDEHEMEKSIIGTISGMDIPKTPAARGLSSFGAYMCGYTTQMLQTERDQILNCTAADIRALKPVITAILEQNAICTIGSATKVNEAKELFKEIKPLIL